jgi:hypothetical protein
MRHWRPRMRFVWLVSLAFAVQSCGASWHLKRAIAKDPTILADAIVRVDTTVVTQSIRAVDTLVVRDTITREIVREGVQIKVKRIHDTIRVDVVCPPDTIRVVAEVPVEQVVIREKAMPLYRRVITMLYLILAILILAWIYRLTK